MTNGSHSELPKEQQSQLPSNGKPTADSNAAKTDDGPIIPDGFVDLSAPTAAKSNRLWWQIGALVLVSTLAVFTGSAFDEEWKRVVPEGRQMASMHNKRATGLQGLSKLAESLGLPVAPWEQPYRQLKEPGTLVLIAPTESLQPFQIEQILLWVNKGNDLIYIDDMTFELSNSVATKLGVTVKSAGRPGAKVEDVDVAPNSNVPETAHVEKLRLASATRVAGGTAIAKDAQGAFLTVIKFGKGRVLFGTCPSILANKTIAKKEYWGNFQFISNWFKTTPGTIYFDEYAHGFSGGTNVFAYLAHGPVGAASAQIILILIIAVISESQRFGAARGIETRRQISNLEFINGLSHAYRRAKANTAVLDILFHAFKNKLSRALAVSPHEPVERLNEAWSQSKFQSSHDLGNLLKQYEEFMTRRDVSDSELKTMVETCDKISTETSPDSSTKRALIGSKS
jgi:hypothetical protein